MPDITLDSAVLELYGDALQALRWYGSLSFQQRQEYVDNIGIHRAQYIQQFTVDTMFFIAECGENGFDVHVLTDLWQRIRKKLQAT